MKVTYFKCVIVKVKSLKHVFSLALILVFN